MRKSESQKRHRKFVAAMSHLRDCDKLFAQFFTAETLRRGVYVGRAVRWAQPSIRPETSGRHKDCLTCPIEIGFPRSQNALLHMEGPASLELPKNPLKRGL